MAGKMEASFDIRADLKLRDCTLGDADIIAEIYNTYIRKGGSTMDTQLRSREDVVQQIEGFHQRETIMMLERAEDNHVLGWGLIKRNSDLMGFRVSCETSIYIQADQLGKGYGTYLKKAVLERCRSMGYHHIVAKIFASNTTSINYNKRLGYEIVGRQREIGYRDGKWQDVVIMQLILDDVPPFKPELG